MKASAATEAAATVRAFPYAYGPMVVLGERAVSYKRGTPAGRELFIDNLLVRTHFIIEMIWWTGLAPWEIEFPCPQVATATASVTDATASLAAAVEAEAAAAAAVEDNTAAIAAKATEVETALAAYNAAQTALTGLVPDLPHRSCPLLGVSNTLSGVSNTLPLVRQTHPRAIPRRSWPPSRASRPPTRRSPPSTHPNPR